MCAKLSVPFIIVHCGASALRHSVEIYFCLTSESYRKRHGRNLIRLASLKNIGFMVFPNSSLKRICNKPEKIKCTSSY